MLKELVRSVVAEGARCSWLLSATEASLTRRLTVVCYPRILPAGEKAGYFLPDLVVTPEAFDAHCATFARRFHVLPLDAAYAAFRAGQSFERPLLAITFDDGYVDNHDLAAPILASHRLHATFFVIAGLVGTSQAPWYDRVGRAVQHLSGLGRAVSAAGELLAQPSSGVSGRALVQNAKTLAPEARRELVERLLDAVGDAEITDRDRLMSWEQVRSLACAGHEIGSHSVSHEILPSLDDATLARELHDSRAILERELGRPVTSLCYPNGDYDARTTALAAEAGYACAVTTQCGTNRWGERPFELKRWFIHEGRLSHPGGQPSSAQLRLELAGLAERVFRRSDAAR